MPKRLLGFVEGAHHVVADVDVGFDRDGLGAGLFQLSLEGFEPVLAPRHQRHRRAIVGKRAGELLAQPGRCAGHQRDAAFKAEEVCGFHGACSGSFPHRP